ncbi:MAG: filamentous hemagglutinin N-terminal domain-containing protein [Rhizobacter sp.]
MRLQQYRFKPVAWACLITMLQLGAAAQPVSNQLPVLKAGGAQINASVNTPAAGSMNITQTASTSNRALLEWTSFSIGSQAKVNFVQPNTQSVMVNRVTGDGKGAASASEIYGGLSANGKVFLINPAGVVFGAGAQVNVGSLVATSLDLADSMTGSNYIGLINGKEVLLGNGLSGGNGTSILVMPAADTRQPQIQVTEGGSILLISRDQVAQNGSISAPKGQIGLTSASTATLLPVGQSGFVDVLLATPAASGGGVSLGLNSQTLATDGSIAIGAQSKDDSARSDSIAIAGVVSADSSSTGQAGSVRIDAGAGGSVTATEGAVITASSTAAGGIGGQVSLMGGNITLQQGTGGNAQVLAEGAVGGGSIAIGNSVTRSIRIEQGTIVSTDASTAGNGGTIDVRAMYNNVPAGTQPPLARVDFGVTEVYGTLRSRGGTQSGDGGYIETSGQALATSLTDVATGLTQTANIDARARAAGGKAGLWTLDPFDVTISNATSSGVNGSFNPIAPGANVLASDLTAALNAGTSIDISTDAGGAGTAAGNITITSGTVITRSAGTAPASFTLRANNNIISNGLTFDATKGGPVNVTFQADLDGNGTGSINLQGGSIATGGGNLTLSGGTNPATGFASGDANNPAVLARSTTLDTRGGAVPGVGDLVIRGQSSVAGSSFGVDLSADMFAGNLSITGLSAHGTAVSLNGSTITTAAGNIDVRGVAVRTDNATPQLTGVDTGTLRIQLGTGSLTLAGRGDDANLATNGGATGLRYGDLQVSAATNSTGRITLAGQATGGSLGQGVQANFGGNSGLVISSNALAAGSPATGANVVIGGQSDAPSSALSLTGSLGPNISTSGAVNIRPLGVSTTGAITEQVAVPITVAPPATAASGTGSFAIDTAWLRKPTVGANPGIGAGQGIVIGSAAHTGKITVEDGAFTQHATVAVTLQNEGTGSQGVFLGGGNTLADLGVLTAGSVAQNVGGIIAQNLVIRGGATSTIDLNQINNQIGVVAFDPPAALTLVTQGNLTVDAASVQTFNAGTGVFTPLAITGSVGGDTALLQSSANVFINRPISMAGTGASLLTIVSPGTVTFANGATLSTAASGKWRVWAPTVSGAPTAGPATNLYGCFFGDSTTCSASNITIPTAGNLFLHPAQPAITVAAQPTTGYLDLTLPNLGFITTGLVNGDTPAAALAGTLAAGVSPGSSTAPITQGTLFSPLGYNVTFQPATLTLRPGITRQPLQSAFLSEMTSNVYGRNLDQPYICTAASVIRGSLADDKQNDPLSSEWGKVRNQPQLSGCLNVTDGGSCSAF